MVMIRRLMAAAMVSAFASGTTMAASTPALKPIDPAALQAAIEGLSKELMLPGAMVLLSTPKGNVIFGYGTTKLGAANPPRAAAALHERGGGGRGKRNIAKLELMEVDAQTETKSMPATRLEARHEPAGTARVDCVRLSDRSV